MRIHGRMLPQPAQAAAPHATAVPQSGAAARPDPQGAHWPRLLSLQGVAIALSAILLPLMAKHLAQAGAQPASAPGPGVNGTSAGSALYLRNCTACHGQDGRGAQGRRTNPQIPDFTSPAWQAQRSDAQLWASILDGKGDAMPAFGDKLKREQLRKLIAYVRAFGPVRATQASPEPGDFEARFAALQEELRQLQTEFERASRQVQREIERASSMGDSPAAADR